MKLSVLEGMLIEEYERMGRVIPVFEEEIKKLPKDSPRRKEIEEKMKVLHRSVKQIERALGKDFIYKHTTTRFD